MAEPDLWDRLLPVGTLLLGAALARVSRRAEARRVAAEQLAELQRRVWTKGGEEDWLDLQVYLGRLRVALSTAGVPTRVIRRLKTAAEQLWEALVHSGDPDIGWYVHGDEDKALDQATEAVLRWLDRPWKIWGRWRAWRASGLPD